MPKVRIYELAKKLNKQSKDILDELARIGIEGKTHTSGIEEDIAKRIADAFSPKPPKEKIAPDALKKAGEIPAGKAPSDIKPQSKKDEGEQRKPEPSSAAIEVPSPCRRSQARARLLLRVKKK